VAVQNLLDTDEKISRIRGQWREFDGIPVMPTYHPAFLLRNPAGKRPVWEDMQEVMKRLKD
jgi:uracil-DNA glycosylase family 4